MLELHHKEDWVLKNWCFWIEVLERVLRVPWTAGISNQSILKGINPEYSLEGLMLKLKLQYFGHLMQKPYSLEKTLILRKMKGKRRRGWESLRWLDSITNPLDMNLSKLWETVKDWGACCPAVPEVVKSQTWLSNNHDKVLASGIWEEKSTETSLAWLF